MRSLRASLLTLTALSLFPLTACEATKDELGLSRRSPDEFSVVRRAPLEMPPDYALRPPAPGTARPQEAATPDQARQTVFGEGRKDATGKVSSGEAALLSQAGAAKVPSNIRQTVNRESVETDEHDKSVTEKLLGWDSTESEEQALDPKAEAERLKAQKKLRTPTK